MAAETERQVEMMTKSLRFFQEDMQRVAKSSGVVAQNLQQLTWQVKFGQRNFMEYVSAAIKLPPVFKEASMALIRDNEQIKDSIKGLQDQQRLGQEMLNQTKEQIKLERADRADPGKLKSLREEKRIYESMVKETKAAIDLEEKRTVLKQRVEAITGRQLAVEFLMIKGFRDAIRFSGEVNEALIQANSLTKIRHELTDQIYAVQAKTGASMQVMLGSARALMAVWPKSRTDFQSTLETVVQMEEGLDVSSDNAAQLARIFQINLKTPVRDIADQIAIIANNTSLAADEAARFATEIGKALRLLGPGAAPGAKEVSGYVTMIAGRMKDVGGDANEIIKMFSEMTKGTPQAFMLRAISGVGTPGALGTQAGAQAAMQGIGKMIDRIVTAAPGTAAYTAQLEAAAQIMGISTETVRLYRDMLKEANRPLDEHAKLQQRWQEQIVNANKALQRVRESFVALIQRALLPLVPPIAWAFGVIARIVSFLASNRVTVGIATIVVVGAIVKTVASLYRLAAALIQVALASQVAAKYQMLSRPFAVGGMAAEGGGFISKIVQQVPWLQKIGVGINGILGIVSKIGRFMVSGPALAVMLAAAIGVSLGLLFNRLFPKLAREIGEGLYHIFNKSQFAQTVYSKPGQKPVWEIMADIRREAIRGHMAEAIRIFEEGKYKVAGLRTEAGAKGYLNQFVATMADVREKIGLTTVTAEEKATLENDRKMIELTKKQVDNSDEYLKRVREYEQRNNSRRDAKRATEERERMLREAQFRMMMGDQSPRKSQIMMPGGLSPY
jgi:hypothetical protein